MKATGSPGSIAASGMAADEEHDAGDERAPLRVAPDRVDREQDPDEEGARLGQRGRGEVRELDDDDGQRQGDERRAPAPGQRGAEGQGGGEADRPIAAKCDSVAISAQ